MKAFPQFTREYIRTEISYENVMYLLSTIPPYRGYEDKKDISKKKDSNKKESDKEYTHFEQFNF